MQNGISNQYNFQGNPVFLHILQKFILEEVEQKVEQTYNTCTG